MENSKLWFVNHQDIIKAGVMFVLSSVLTVIYTALTNKMGIDWASVGNVAILSTVTYLLKQLGTDTQGKFLGKV
ncbi:MAG: hypothetical protein WC243_03810 [Patescibacteria group bacterium]|jgi:hypothetical protein